MRKMLRLLVVAVLIWLLPAAGAPAFASHEVEPAAVACSGNGVCQVGNGIALTAPETSVKSVAFVAYMFRTEVGERVPSLIGAIPE